MESLRSFLKQSLDKYGMPFPVDKRVCSGWARDLPHGGETIIFTSCMYQIEPVVPTLSKFSSMAGALTGALKGLSSFAKLVKPPKEEMERAYTILNNIVNALRRRESTLGTCTRMSPIVAPSCWSQVCSRISQITQERWRRC